MRRLSVALLFVVILSAAGLRGSAQDPQNSPATATPPGGQQDGLVDLFSGVDADQANPQGAVPEQAAATALEALYRDILTQTGFFD